MNAPKYFCIRIVILCFISLISFDSYGQTLAVGSGSYTKTFPGTDSAGRNAYPQGSPQLSGNAAGKPVPTNDWWSSLVKENHVSNKSGDWFTESFRFVLPGYNVRPLEMSGAIGIEQLKKLPKFIENRRLNAEHFVNLFQNHP